MTTPFKMNITNEIEQWRQETFWTKEPETLEWINSFDGDNFIDIGANIGVYSLYCAHKHPNMWIYAIEPDTANFQALQANFALNNFKSLTPYCLGVSNKTGWAYLDGEDGTPGKSGRQINESTGRATRIITLDHLAELSFPNYIKIDTDGNEYDILLGGQRTLKEKSLKSVLVEVNDHKQEILQLMATSGFTTDNRFNVMTPHSRERRQLEGIAAENIIFTKKHEK